MKRSTNIEIETEMTETKHVIASEAKQSPRDEMIVTAPRNDMRR